MPPACRPLLRIRRRRRRRSTPCTAAGRNSWRSRPDRSDAPLIRTPAVYGLLDVLPGQLLGPCLLRQSGKLLVGSKAESDQLVLGEFGNPIALGFGQQGIQPKPLFQPN